MNHSNFKTQKYQILYPNYNCAAKFSLLRLLVKVFHLKKVEQAA